MASQIQTGKNLGFVSSLGKGVKFQSAFSSDQMILLTTELLTSLSWTQLTPQGGDRP